MKTIRDKIESDVIVEQDTILHGMIVGRVTVVGGASFFLHGTVIGDVEISGTSSVFLHGTVHGLVKNKDGKLEVYGTVHGHVISESEDTLVGAEAVIRSK